jgi:aldehyde dehydrogenase (NAD+)
MIENENEIKSELTNEYAAVLRQCRRRAALLRFSSVEERVVRLRRLRKAILDAQSSIEAALAVDFKKPAVEVVSTEILPVIDEIDFTCKHLGKWARTRRRRTPLFLFGASSEIQYQARGVVLLISPWNYPIQLCLRPLVSAIAAGNAVILKPSEYTPETNMVMRRILAQVFAEDEVAVVEGDATVTHRLLDLRFDLIFFTGSTVVGKIIMQRAAEKLVPVILELGGKSPAIVDQSADITLAAERLVWAKFLNSGQTCVAPDYVYVHANVADEFLRQCQHFLRKFYAASPQMNLCQIITERHYARFESLCQSAKQAGAQIVSFVENDPRERFFAPTFVVGARWDMPIMQDEIFGPLFPVLKYDDLGDVLQALDRDERPLGLYIFARDRVVEKKILQATQSGSAVVNHGFIFMLNSHLPFGGVGNSGMGTYHGESGFQAFSHSRPVMRQWLFWSVVSLSYPPYTGLSKKLVQLLVKIQRLLP